MTTFREVSESRYDEMLGALPPALWLAHGFLVGEPTSHRECRVKHTVRPTFAAFVTRGGRFYEAAESMTAAEFRAVTDGDLPAR